MFSSYQSLNGESPNDHLSRLRRQIRADKESGRRDRRRMFRAPILMLSYDGLLLLRDMTAVERPSINACLAPPIAITDKFDPRGAFTYNQIVGGYIRERMLPARSSPRVPGNIQPLGIYKNFAADGRGRATDVTSLPAQVQLDIHADDVKIVRDFAHFRGEPSWLAPQEAEKVLRQQADEISDNRLAAESLLLVVELNRRLGERVDAAHS